MAPHVKKLPANRKLLPSGGKAPAWFFPHEQASCCNRWVLPHISAPQAVWTPTGPFHSSLLGLQIRLRSQCPGRPTFCHQRNFTQVRFRLPRSYSQLAMKDKAEIMCGEASTFYVEVWMSRSLQIHSGGKGRTQESMNAFVKISERGSDPRVHPQKGTGTAPPDTNRIIVFGSLDT